MSYKILFTKQAQKDYEKILKSNYKEKLYKLLSIIESNPLQPSCEKLVDLPNTYSKRINVQHRLVYVVHEEEKTVVVVRLWTHYGDN